MNELRTMLLEVSGETVDAAELGKVFGRIGDFVHLVSMAGGSVGGLEALLNTIREAVEEKLFANLVIARLAVPRFKDGRSMASIARPGGRPHNASGAIIGNDGIRSLVQGLAVELAPRCRANAVAPTYVYLMENAGQTIAVDVGVTLVA